MKKIIILLAAIAGLCFVLVVAAVLILPKYLDVQSYKPIIEKKVSEITGRDFTLGGDFNVSVFPWVGVSFADLQLGNPQDFGGGDFVKVKSFEARMKLIPLLSKKIEVKKFVLDGPQLTLTKRKNGQVSWEFPVKEKRPEKGKLQKPKGEEGSEAKTSDIPISSLEVGEFSITNGNVRYIDEALGVTKEITGITLKLEDVSLDQPIALQFQADIDGKPLQLIGSLGPIGSQPGKGTIKLNLDIKALGQLAVKVSGEIMDAAGTPSFDMQFGLSSFSPRRVFEALGSNFPVKMADSTVLDKVAADIHVSGDPAHIAVSSGSVVLDDSTVKFDAQVKDFNKPDISINVALDSINIDRYLPPVEEKNEKAQETTKSKTQKSGTISEGGTGTENTQPIDYTPLRKLVLKGNLQIGKLVAHGAKVEDVTMTVAGKDGVFQISPLSLGLYQGKLDVKGDFDVNGDAAKASLNILGNDIHVGPLLRDSMKKDILEGNAHVDAQLSFTGESADAVKKSLNGKGEFKFLDGAIVGIDLAEMARNITSSLGADKPKEKPKTDFAELNVPFTITDGLFQTQDTKLLSPLLRITMLGSANLVSEVLDFKVRPKLVATLKGQGDTSSRSGVTVPLLVEGTFADPKFSADLSAMASSDVVKEALRDPKGTAEKAKAVEETGKKLLKSFGFGN